MSDHLKYDNQLIEPIRIGNTPWDVAFAGGLAELTIVWGRVEYWLFLVLEAIDTKQSAKWTQVFLRTNAVEARVEETRKQIARAIGDAAPELLSAFLDAESRFEDIRHRRNLLMHGVWRRLDETHFEITPLRLVKKKNKGDQSPRPLEKIAQIDAKFLSQLLGDIDKLVQRLAAIVGEIRAHQFMQTDLYRRITGGKRG